MYKNIGVLLLCSIARAASSGPTASQIVLKADEVRNPQIDYTDQVAVTSMRPGHPEDRAMYEVLIKGKEKTVIKTLAPANSKGTSLLMLGRDLWTFLPDVSQPVRISLQQRLLGQVAVGDIARANFAGDYNAKLTNEGLTSYQLELTAVSEAVTYHRILYWVTKGDYHPIKAEFYGPSGKMLKTCSYENYRMMAGRVRPARLVMADPVISGQKSIVELSDMRASSLPDKYFNKEYLKKLKY